MPKNKSKAKNQKKLIQKSKKTQGIAILKTQKNPKIFQNQKT
jgi:hypothetical protein